MLLLLGALWAAGQGTFVNLDFERGVIVVDPASPYYPHQVLASKALPGWTAYTYEQPLVDILYDAIFFSSAQVGIYDTNYPSLAPVQGRYCVVLGGQMPGTLPQESAAIAQTGRVPNTAESLTFWGQVGGLQVTFGGQVLPYAAIGRGPNYTIYGCDISAFAGQAGDAFRRLHPAQTALIFSHASTGTCSPGQVVVGSAAIQEPLARHRGVQWRPRQDRR